jgi:hypothetical protein
MTDNLKTVQFTQVLTPVTVAVDVKALIESSEFLPGGYNDDTDEYEPGAPLIAMVAEILANSIKRDIRTDVRAAVEEEVRSQVREIVTEVIDGTVRVTNAFGEPTGGSMTLRERIVKEAQEVLTKPVNANNGSFDRYSGRDSVPLSTYIAREEAKKALQGELAEAAKQAVVEVKAGVKSIVAQELSAKVAAAVTSGLAK